MKNFILIIIITIFLISLCGCNEIIEEDNYENELSKPEIIDLRIVEFDKEGFYPQLFTLGLLKNTAKINIKSIKIKLSLLDKYNNTINNEIIKVRPEIIKQNDFGVFIFRKSVDIHDKVIVQINSYSYTNETYYDDLILNNIKISEKSDDYFSIDGIIKNNGSKNINNITILILAFDNESKILDIGGSSSISSLNSGQIKYFKSSISIFDKWYNVDEIKSTDFKIVYDN
jgi:hypothetical protein